MENSLEILKTIPYSQLYLWDVKRFAKLGISSKYNIVQLSNYITERNEKVKLFEFPEKEFGILGVNNKIGIFDAYREFGKNINQAYKKVENHDLAYNPYRINVGSIGWKTENQKYDFISPAYVVFKTHNGLFSEFLYRMFKTDTFNKIIRDNTTGSVRQNLKFSTLSNINIPLPPLTEQNRLVANYNAKIQLANEQEQKAKELEQEIEEYLFEVLGIKKLEDKKIVKGLQYVNYKNLDRWDVLAKDLRTLNGLSNCKYELKKIGEVFEFPSRTWKKKEYKSSTFKYIELGAIDPTIGITELKEIEVKNAPSRATQQVKTGDFLIGTTRPYLKRFVIIEPKYNECICSSGFSIIAPSSSYNLFYLKEFLMSYFGIEQLKNRMTGGTYPAITNNELKEILVPLPKVEIQNKIANHILSLRQQIKDLKSQAVENRKKAIQDFEQEIFTKS